MSVRNKGGSVRDAAMALDNAAKKGLVGSHARLVSVTFEPPEEEDALPVLSRTLSPVRPTSPSAPKISPAIPVSKTKEESKPIVSVKTVPVKEEPIKPIPSTKIASKEEPANPSPEKKRPTSPDVRSVEPKATPEIRNGKPEVVKTLPAKVDMDTTVKSQPGSASRASVETDSKKTVVFVESSDMKKTGTPSISAPFHSRNMSKPDLAKYPSRPVPPIPGAPTVRPPDKPEEPTLKPILEHKRTTSVAPDIHEQIRICKDNFNRLKKQKATLFERHLDLLRGLFDTDRYDEVGESTDISTGVADQMSDAYRDYQLELRALNKQLPPERGEE